MVKSYGIPADKSLYHATIAKAREEQTGFLTLEQVRTLVNSGTGRLAPVLVRCGGGRFTCPAQDVEHFVDIITKSKIDYVRDVGLVAGYSY